MGRGPKTGVDYFSHDVLAALKPTLFTVQNSYGNDGYAFWFKLWEFIGTQEGLFADFSTQKQKDWRYFLSIARVDEEKAEAILKLLTELDAIDKDLWLNHRIVWSDNFRDRVASVFTKRGTPVPDKPSFGEAKKEDESSKEESPAPQKKGGCEKKVKYADYVSMTEEEYKALVEKIGEPATIKCIETLDNYKGSNGKTYKSDYRAILTWVIEAVKEKHKELFQTNAKTQTDAAGNPFADYNE